ncbi:MAG TPA: hypothetical protein VGM02_15135 [Acidobacteriaceae bacterium]|jgi:hypothetical protein
MSMQQLRYGEEEQPEAKHGSKNTEDEDGSHLLVGTADPGVSGVALTDGIRACSAMGCRPNSDTRAKGGH